MKRLESEYTAAYMQFAKARKERRDLNFYGQEPDEKTFGFATPTDAWLANQIRLRVDRELNRSA